MSKVDKIQFLESLEDKVENHLKETIHTFQNLHKTVLLKPADNNGWSMAQCFDHLNSYGNYYLPQIKKGLTAYKGESTTYTFSSTWLGTYFTNMMQPENTKKYKAFKGHIPSIELDAHAVLAEFIEQQEMLLSYLKQAKNVDINKVRIPISIAKFIKLKLGDVFQFMIAHDERHLQQAKRNL